MQVYVCVVDSHGFARAAEVLGLPRSTVSRVIKELEAYLGIQLLQRTTRKLSVTVDGRSYYTECKRLLAEIATLESSFPGRFAQPRGRFKVGMPQSLARHCIIPGLPEFLQQYPGLDITICSSDDVEDIIQEGYDCAIRTGRIDDSTTLVARPPAVTALCSTHRMPVPKEEGICFADKPAKGAKQKRSSPDRRPARRCAGTA